jgi:broad specificity phosphatase PhoE
MCKPAVFSSGHIETGFHHAEAYSKLTVEEKDAFDLLVSGYVNSDGTFTTEMKHPNKNMLVVRHAESLNNIEATDHLNGDITSYGDFQAHMVSNHMSEIGISDYVGYTSPMLRCLKTARYIHRKTGINFKVCPELAEVPWVFPENGLEIAVMADLFWEMDWGSLIHEETLHFPKETDDKFVGKLSGFLDLLSHNSVVVTHGTCVMTLVELSLGAKVEKVPEWDGSIKNASLTHVSNGTLKCLSKVVY